MSAPRQIAPPYHAHDGELHAVPGSLRCTIVPSDNQAEEKIVKALRYLLSIARDRKREA